MPPLGRNPNMTIRELRDRYGVTSEELAELVGVEPDRIVRNPSKKVNMAWTETLVAAGLDPQAEAETPEPELDGEPPAGIGADRPPRAPDDARIHVHVPPRAPSFDSSLLADHIEGIYRVAAHAVGTSDPSLEAAIAEHAAKAGVAWARWVESEPKVQALLARLMVGTPMGEVIGVHVSIVFAYVVARSVERERIAREHAPGEPAPGQTAQEGNGDLTAEDFLGLARE